MTYRKAFTLMELLVALAVLVILGALTFPVFTGVRERGKMTRCASNLRQIGIGMGRYLDDWDSRYPWAAQEIWVVRAHFRPTLRQTMAAYVPVKEIWQCPSDVGEIRPEPEDVDGFSPPSPVPFYSEARHGTSYAYWGFNGTFDSPYFGDPHRVLSGRRTSQIRTPAGAVCLVEISPWHDRGNADSEWFHHARMNVLFCDGHVARQPQEKWIKGTEYVTGNM